MLPLRFSRDDDISLVDCHEISSPDFRIRLRRRPVTSSGGGGQKRAHGTGCRHVASVRNAVSSGHVTCCCPPNSNALLFPFTMLKPRQECALFPIGLPCPAFPALTLCSQSSAQNTRNHSTESLARPVHQRVQK